VRVRFERFCGLMSRVLLVWPSRIGIGMVIRTWWCSSFFFSCGCGEGHLFDGWCGGYFWEGGGFESRGVF
jgi:hypothetical protein